MKLNALAASSAALAASGTVTLELALAQVPSVIAYKVNPLSAIMGYFLVNRDAVVLPNKLIGKKYFRFIYNGNALHIIYIRQSLKKLKIKINLSK